MIAPSLVLPCELFVDPQEFLSFVYHTHETAEAGVFGFEQGVEFTQGRTLDTDGAR